MASFVNTACKHSYWSTQQIFSKNTFLIELFFTKVKRRSVLLLGGFQTFYIFFNKNIFSGENDTTQRIFGMDVENTTLIWIVLGGCALLVLLCLAGQFNIWKLGLVTNQFRFIEHFSSCNKKQDMLNFLSQNIFAGNKHHKSGWLAQKVPNIWPQLQNGWISGICCCCGCCLQRFCSRPPPARTQTLEANYQKARCNYFLNASFASPWA